MNDTFVVALEKPSLFVQAYDRGQERALIALLWTVAWRLLRHHFRRKSSQCELSGEAHLAQANAPDTWSPATLFASNEMLVKTLALIDEAAVRFGGKHPEALAAALYMRMSGSSDTEAARTYNVPREYVNRAKRWIVNHLDASYRN